MADGSIQAACGSPSDVLARIVEEFAWLSDRALAGIAAGGVAGYIKPSLAVALVDARRAVRPVSFEGAALLSYGTTSAAA